MPSKIQRWNDLLVRLRLVAAQGSERTAGGPAAWDRELDEREELLAALKSLMEGGEAAPREVPALLKTLRDQGLQLGKRLSLHRMQIQAKGDELNQHQRLLRSLECPPPRRHARVDLEG